MKGERHMTMEAEVEMLQLQGKEPQRLMATTRSWAEARTGSPT